MGWEESLPAGLRSVEVRPMIVIASANGSVGIEAAMRVLRDGGSALDAVEAGIKPVESNPADHTVGYSGLPNLVGDVEVDASIMDGLSLQAGAVGAVVEGEKTDFTRITSQQSIHWRLATSGPLQRSTSFPPWRA